jgi:predicted nucleic acid-binding protein
MILADTSVWIDHLRTGNHKFVDVLRDGGVLCHPFIIGELACGNLKNRNKILELLGSLPSVKIAEHDEVLRFISIHKLHGRRIGWIDSHLLASTFLTKCKIWTLDRPLLKVARVLNISVRV